MKIRIGTRKSKLALAQTELVKSAIEKNIEDVEVIIVPMSTKGDEILDKSLKQIGGKGVFTKELEEALLDNRIDMAVHSAKDMPMDIPDGLMVAPILERADPYDICISKRDLRLSELPNDSVIGTSSLRRELQVMDINPYVIIKDLRGNINTRINKLRAGEYDAIILAAAGLKRLTEDKNSEILHGLHIEAMDPTTFLPAAGQGILGIEIRKGELSEVIKVLENKDTNISFDVERQFLKTIGAGCNAPCGAYCKLFNREMADEIINDEVIIYTMYAKDSKNMLYKTKTAKIKDAIMTVKKMAEVLR